MASVGVPSRSELETRPLADLHLYASKLGVKRYRLMRREDLTETLLKQTGQERPSRSSNGAPGVSEPQVSGPQVGAEPESDRQVEAVETIGAQGVLDVTRRGHGFLRGNGLTRSRDDAYVSRGQIRRLDLRSGDRLAVRVRPARRSERYPSVEQVESVNGGPPGSKRAAVLERLEPSPEARTFDALAASDNLTARMIELVVPIGRGQSILIGTSEQVDATEVLCDVARGLAATKEVELTFVVIGGDRRRADEWSAIGDATVEVADADERPGARVGVAQLAVECAKRRAEQGIAAVVLLDSAGALAAAHGEARRERAAYGEDSEQAAAASVSRLLGAARDTREAGSLTIVAISPDRGPLHEALLDVAAGEIVLDDDLAAERLRPPIDLTRSSGAEAGAGDSQLRAGLRSVINSLEPKEAWEFVTEKLSETDSNEALLRE